MVYYPDENHTSSSALRSILPSTLWTLKDDHNLMLALSRNIHLRPIPWHHVIHEFPHKSPAEVLKRINHCLQDIQRDLLTQAVQLSALVPVVPNQQVVHQLHTSSSSSLTKPKRQAHARDHGQPRKKRSEPVPWLAEDHNNFLRGIKAHGWGNWKKIQASFLLNKTVAQITSHAQKHLKKAKKTSIHDDDNSDVTDCRILTSLPRYDDLSERDYLLELRMS